MLYAKYVLLNQCIRLKSKNDIVVRKSVVDEPALS